MAKEHKLLFQLNAQLNGGFNGTFSKAQAEFSRLGKEIQTLNRTQSDISAYQKQQAAIEATTQKLASLQRQQQALGREKGALDQQIREAQVAGQSTAALERQKAALEREEARLGQRIETTNTSLQHQQERLSATSSRLQSAGADTNNLSASSARLSGQIQDLRARQEEAANGAEDFGVSMTDAFAAASQAVAAAGLVSAFQEIAGAYKECVTIAADFEESMSGVQALSSAGAAELDTLTASAKAMGAETKYTATESANAFQYMALAGWNTNKMLSGIEPVLNLATAANMDLAQASDIVTDYLTAFGLTADDASGFVDQMAYAMSHSNTNVVQLGEAYKNCAATAHSLGYTVEETTAIIMTMANAGIKGGESGTALSAIMTRLATDTKDCASELKEYGVYVYNEATGSMNSLSTILNGVAEVWTTLTDAEQAALAKSIAGTNHYKSLQTIMNGCSKAAAESGQSFNDYVAALSNCSGTAGKMAGTMLNNMNGQLTLAKSAWDAVKTTIGEQFTPVLKNLLKIGTDALTWVNKILAANPALIKGITALIAVAATLTTGVVALSAAMKIASVAAGLLAGTLPGLNVFAAIAGIAGLTGAVVTMTAANNEAVPSVNELAAAAHSADSAMQAAKEPADAEAETTASANSANKYIDRLEELGSATRHTAAEKQQYHNILMMLCETMPELSEYIDTETNSIKGGTDALREHVEALKQDAQQQAYQEAYTEELKKQAEIEKELAKSQFEKFRTEENLKSLQEQRRKIVQEMNKQDANDPAAFLKYKDLERDLDKINGQIDDAEASIKNYNQAISDSSAALQTVTDGLAEIEEYAQRIKFSEQGDFTQAEIDQLAALDTALQNSAVQLAALEESYAEAYDEAYTTFSGMFGLFDQANIDTQATVANAQAALDSQLNYWDTYGANIEFIKSKSAADLGITQENYNTLISFLSTGSAEAAGLAKSIVDNVNSGNTQAVAKMAQTATAVVEAQKTVAQETADWVTGFSQKADEVVQKTQDTIQAMNLSPEATKAAENTINAYISAIDRKGALVAQAYKRIADNAKAAINSIPTMPSIYSSMGAGANSGDGSSHFWSKGYASGTLHAPPGWSWVGEEGPELINLRGGEAILPADTSAAFAAAAAMPEIQSTPQIAETINAYARESAAVGNVSAQSAIIEAAAFSPQIIEALQTRVNPPVMAESAAYAPVQSAPVTIHFDIHIDGNATPETVDKLYDFKEEMREMVLDVLSEERISARRNAYI